ncbi:MAG TPA: hypothetical protein VNZ67_12735, partial [bacterium]|nr:hypothetical protein [bacterium]
HLSELRAIEQNKVSGAKMILGLFGVLLFAALCVVTFYAPVQQLFGFGNLKVFSYFAVVALSFMVLPTYVGLSLAGSRKSLAMDKKRAEKAGA